MEHARGGARLRGGGDARGPYRVWSRGNAHLAEAPDPRGAGWVLGERIPPLGGGPILQREPVRRACRDTAVDGDRSQGSGGWDTGSHCCEGPTRPGDGFLGAGGG